VGRAAMLAAGLFLFQRQFGLGARATREQSARGNLRFGGRLQQACSEDSGRTLRTSISKF